MCRGRVSYRPLIPLQALVGVALSTMMLCYIWVANFSFSKSKTCERAHRTDSFKKYELLFLSFTLVAN